MPISFETLLGKIAVNGETRFFERYWRKELFHMPGVLGNVGYTCDDFLTEYAAGSYAAQTLTVNVDERGVRRMVRPPAGTTVTVNPGEPTSLVVQGIMLADNRATVPEVWRAFIDLQFELCAYLLPDMPPGLQPDGPIAAVDIFHTTGETSTGGHYDPSDVFYFVLDGEKDWSVELFPNPERVLELYASPHENYMRDHAPGKTPVKITLKVGDALYVPPFTYHRVSSSGRSLAVSVGLPTYTEATLIKQVARARERSGRVWNIWEPLESVPRALTGQYEQVSARNAARISSFLNTIKSSTENLGVKV